MILPAHPSSSRHARLKRDTPGFPRALVIVFAFVPLAAPATDYDRLYDFMIDANKAQVVMLHEQALIDESLARDLAGALVRVVDEGMPPREEATYPNYLGLESRLTDLIGDRASNIHLGRSRNDLGAAINLMLMRQQALDLVVAIAGVRDTLQRIATDNVETIMPGFTHGVQAQPTTLAHFMLAFDARLQRDSERLTEAYRRINRSPLGSGAFTTSGFALDRERLAELLGFPRLVENAYDAVMMNPADTKVEFASALSISALGVGRLAQYLLFQYDDPAPGLVLSDSLTGRSSIMPQKRSPSAIERLRLTASEVVGRAHTSALFVHNTPMYEVKDARQDHLYRLIDLVSTAAQMYQKLDRILDALTVRADLLRRKVDDDYSTMTELADTLKREAGVPFRVGHEVASELTTHARREGKTVAELGFAEVATVYRGITGESLPLNRSQLRAVFDAAAFVNSRKGIGGPQPDEVTRMLRKQQAELEDLLQWHRDETARLERARRGLDRAFLAIAGVAGAPADPSAAVSLDSWQPVGDDLWRHANGETVAGPAEATVFLVSPASYADFRLSLEYRVEDHTNSGIYIRCSAPREITPDLCYEINIWDNHANPSSRTGSIVGLVPPVVHIDGLDRWVHVEVEAVGPRVRAYFDGQLTAELEGDRARSGRIALQYGGTGELRFRRAVIERLE